MYERCPTEDGRCYPANFGSPTDKSLLAYKKAKSGFALIIALGLMSFILLLLVGLTTLLQVELQTQTTDSSHQIAQSNARLALKVALGELQKYTGPDQRITARADIQGNVTDGNRFWTGVWDATDDTHLTWLVSGNAPPTQTLTGFTNKQQPTSNTVALMTGPGSVLSVDKDANNTPDEFIVVPKVPVSATNNNGHYAYWISDESTKASVGHIDKSDFIKDEFFPINTANDEVAFSPIQIVQQNSVQRYQRELFFPKLKTSTLPDPDGPLSQKDLDSLKNRSSILNTQSIQNFAYLDPVKDDEIKESFLDITKATRGLLTNTKIGGLKKDLSDPEFTDENGAFKVNTTTRSYLEHEISQDRKIELKGISENDLANLAPGDPIFTQPLIITELTMRFGAFSISNKTSRSGVMDIRPFVETDLELWAPFGFRFNAIDAADSDNFEDYELRLKISNLPRMTFTYTGICSDDEPDSASLLNIIAQDLDDLIEPEFSIDLKASMEAGEVLKQDAFWFQSASKNKNGFFYKDEKSWWEVNTGKSSTTVEGCIQYSSVESNITVELTTKEGRILQRLENIPFEAIDKDDTVRRKTASNAPILFHFKLREDLEVLDPNIGYSPRELMTSHIDMRSPVIDFTETVVEALYEIGDPGIRSEDTYDSTDFFYGNNGNSYYTLFDVPNNAATTSIGNLTNLQFHKKPSFSIGNIWGNEHNEVFDKYFFSTIPRDNDIWKPNEIITTAQNLGNSPLPNTHLLINSSIELNELQNENSAQHLMTQGSFNINSTSTRAWESLLSGNKITDWHYKNGQESALIAQRKELHSPFFRLPNTAHEMTYSTNFYKMSFPFVEHDPNNESTDYPQLSAEEKSDSYKNDQIANFNKNWKPSYRLGLREIPQQDLNALSRHIVEALQKRQKPFSSLREFVNSGLLQEAIDKTPINTIDEKSYTDSDSDHRIPRMATSFLSQSDVLAKIAPLITTRSDTFKIRAYGDSVNPITQEIAGKVWCEATVQRVHERIDGDVSKVMENAQGLGRAYKIVDFRWLSENEI